MNATHQGRTHGAVALLVLWTAVVLVSCGAVWGVLR